MASPSEATTPPTLTDEAAEIINAFMTTMELRGMKSTIQLPSVVVIGNQNSGKSSLLESIVKRPFMSRGQLVPTRCPIILQLHPINEKTERPNGISSKATEWNILRDSDGNQKANENFSDLAREMKSKTEEIIEKGLAISDKPLSVDIYASNVLPLRLVDLPGLIPNGGDLGKSIYELCKNYVSNNNAIIVAVSSGDDSPTNSQALILANDVDPTGERTLAVFTKMDLAEAVGNSVELFEHVAEGFANKGIICVINRNQKQVDDNMPLSEIPRFEREHFQKVCPALATRHGTLHLEAELSKMLKQHLNDYFPR